MADTTPEHQLAEPRIMEIAKGVGLDIARLDRNGGAETAGEDRRHHRSGPQAGHHGHPRSDRPSGRTHGPTGYAGSMPYQALRPVLSPRRGRPGGAVRGDGREGRPALAAPMVPFTAGI